MDALRRLVRALEGPGGNSGALVQLSGTVRTPLCSEATASGSTASGVKSVTFVASSDFSGTLLGQTFAASASFTFTAPPGDTLGSIGFTRSAGTLYIYYIP